MAIQSVCARLSSGIDASCVIPARKYYQQAVLINKSDIEDYEITLPDGETVGYNVTLTLKDGTKGYRIQGPESGSSFFGSFDKTRSDYGFAQYAHNVQLLMAGNDENTKSIIDALDKGSFVAALQLQDGTVEIYGVQNGLTTGDYTYNLQEGGGAVPITLSSLDTSPEGTLPLIYKSATPDGEGADFDTEFSNVA